MLSSTMVEYVTPIGEDMPEHRSTEIITQDGKEYAIVGRAQAILSGMADEVGIPRSYSRFAVYRLAVDNGVEILSTPSANYYSVDGLRGLKDKIRPGRGNKSGRAHYTAEQKARAIQIYESGKSCREVAEATEISYQSVNNWVTAAGLKRQGRNA
jgi:hypothetical protein